jgi:hypothetical protein
MSNSNDQKQHDQDVSTLTEGIRKQFQPGGKLAPRNDLAEYQRQMNALPPGERELAQEVTIYANMCQFFSEKKWTVPYEIRQAVLEVRTMEIPDRIARMREVNEALMECIHSATEDSELRM